MAYTRYKQAQMGKTQTGLVGTAGYQLVNDDNTLNGARITAGITERHAGTGTYGADIVFPAGFRGEIRWDNGAGSPLYYTEEINPETGEYLTAAPATANAIFDQADGVEVGWTLRQVLRLMAAVLLGKSSGFTTAGGIGRFRDLRDTKDRVVATVDSQGNRIATTEDPA